MKSVIDIIGTTIGQYKIIEKRPKGFSQNSMWLVECLTCGERLVKRRDHLDRTHKGCTTRKKEIRDAGHLRNDGGFSLRKTPQVRPRNNDYMPRFGQY